MSSRRAPVAPAAPARGEPTPVAPAAPGGGAQPRPGADVAAYALRLGDDALVLSHRLCEWVGRAPELEEDLALANIALDLLGQARALLTYAGSHDGRSEDALAFLRPAREFTNACLVELDNGDFGRTIARQVLFAGYQCELYAALGRSADATLAAVSAKAATEVAYHLDHARSWLVRLGDGTPESHARVQAGLEQVWPLAAQLFEPDPLTSRLAAAGLAPDPTALLPGWSRRVGGAVAEATLRLPPAWRAPGPPRGSHTEAFGPMVARMQQLHRCHPGASW